MQDASSHYAANLSNYQQALAGLVTKRSRIGWARLIIVLATAFVAYYTLQIQWWIFWSVLLCGIASFLAILSLDANVKAAMEQLERLIAINTDELKILQHQFSHRENGACFQPQEHAYAEDLDIFGNASLYQYINRCSGEQGKSLLAQKLLFPDDKQQVLTTQQAVKELAGKLMWRQAFQAWGQAAPTTIDAANRINKWLQQPNDFTKARWQWLSWLFPAVTLSATFLLLTDVLPLSGYSVLLFVCYYVSMSISKKIQPTYLLLSNIVPQIKTIHQQLKQLEDESFATAAIQAVKSSVNRGTTPASVELTRLEHILNLFEVRLNVFLFFFLNTFLLWDVWQIRLLNKWKNNNRTQADAWFGAIATMEVWSSLAALSFNHPDWCFPQIADEHFTLQGTNMGHPLIASGKRVNNNLSIAGTGKVVLITGSNMGGKSTFLRSTGVNVVLALMGAPVCAASFSVSPVTVMSSMRIADNLAENTSTFYAELKKLRRIIEAVNEHRKVFVLLDEMLRGTNTYDRHAGSQALITQMIAQQATGIIATHDVALTSLKEQYASAIANYHFDVQIDSNDELYFDFKLKEGVCTTMNAAVLMRKIGIHVADKEA